MTEEQTKKTPSPRSPKRTYVEIQRANRETEIKGIARLKEREAKAFAAFDALRSERIEREAALNAPVDPDMAGVVSSVVDKAG